MQTIAIQRDTRFSPHSVEKDYDILAAVAQPLNAKIIAENNLKAHHLAEANIILNMGRLPHTLQMIEKYAAQKCVVNPTNGIRNCQRSLITKLMRNGNIPIPPQEGNKGYWLKRGDEAAQSENDIIYCANKKQLQQAKTAFSKRGITNTVVQAHVEGDLVKFYGVNNTHFFRYYYPTDDGITKFADEQHNGTAHHFPFQWKALETTANHIATLANTPVYGGDAIVTAEGTFYIIDFNDWPSFSRCKNEAAKAINLCVAMQLKI